MQTPCKQYMGWDSSEGTQYYKAGMQSTKYTPVINASTAVTFVLKLVICSALVNKITEK